MREKLVNHCMEILEGQSMSRNKEYYYNSLPLAVIDAIFSINQCYSHAEKVVKSYCDYYKLIEFKDDTSSYDIHTISDLITNIESKDIGLFAKEVLNSSSKTAGKNPNLKAKTLCEWAKILKLNGIETFEDFKKADHCKLRKDLLKTHGQGEAAVRYLFMLCGDENICKPDRHIIDFLSEILNRKVEVNEVQPLLEYIVDKLKKKYKDITVRQLDAKIWEYQRNQKKRCKTS